MAAAAFSAVDEIEKQFRSRMEVMFNAVDDPEKCKFHAALYFKKFDIDKSGRLDEREFVNGMVSAFNFAGQSQVLKKLFDRYDGEDDKDDNKISYVEFIEKVLGLVPNAAGDPKSRSVLEKVRAVITKRGGMNGIRTLGRLFRIMDDNGSGTLTYDEVGEGLRDMGLRGEDALSKKDCKKLFSIFDKDKSGTVSFDEFMRAIRGKMSTKRKHLVYYAFDLLDKDKSGEVDQSDLAQAYDCSKHPEVIRGEKTPAEVLKEFSEQWDGTKKDGKITLHEFLDYYKDISASVDNDDYFELMMRNAWHISGGEGAAANTSNLRVLVIHKNADQEVCEVQDDLGLKKGKDRAAYTRAIIAKLEKQGVTDIKQIKFSG